MAIEYAQRIAKLTGFDIIMLNPGVKRWENVERHFFVSVERWLNLMANANILITNSYHGLSFAILFERDFRLCLLPAPSKNNSRMEDLLDNHQLSDYILRDKNYSFDPIDWNRVKCSLKQMVQKSENYIKNIIINTTCR